MLRDARIYLHDLLEACGTIAEFVEGKTYEDYAANLLLRSGVERQLAIIGEALNQALRLEPDFAKRISSTRQIIDFRNLLIHAYVTVSSPVIWTILEGHLPVLKSEVEALLTELDAE